ncbi:MAG: hypothetical protein QXO32_07500 [Candidatus Bathyarchaeia archaeon]
MGYVTVSAKLPWKLKTLLDKYGVKPGPIIRKALEDEVKKRMLSEVKEEAEKLSQHVSHIPDEKVVKLIRGDREMM